MSAKLDYQKTFKQLYRPPLEPVIVDVPPLNYLMLDGHGDPNTSQEYQQAVPILFQFAYALKFAVKKSLGIDYGVLPLEGLWWVEKLDELDMIDRRNWLWTSMIMQPEHVTPELVEELRPQVLKKSGLPAVTRVRYERYTEGCVVQMKHVGHFSTEMPNVERMHAFARSQGYQLRGKHHEIYISDFRRTAPERLQTVLRQPVEK